MNQTRNESDSADPLIDEVRQVRADICEAADHDIDRLANELRKVGEEYDARRGIFSAVSPEAAARVVASWGDVSAPADDPLIDEVRAIRSSSNANMPASSTYFKESR